MKLQKQVLAGIIIVLSMQFAYSQDATQLRNEIDIHAQNEVNNWSGLTYYGNVTIKSADERNGYTYIKGTINYYSNNCKKVTAKYDTKAKIILGEWSVQAFCLLMPYCIGGKPIKYDSEGDCSEF